MKILLIGDPHFKKDNLDIMQKVCQEILQIIDQRKPDIVIVLGDTLDTHERLYLKAQTDAVNFFKEIANRSELIVLIGNHDRQNNSDFLSGIHPFVALKEHPHMTIVDSTIWDQEHNFIYVPYVPNGRFNEALSKIEYNPYENGTVNINTKHPLLIFAHQEFVGCIMGMITSSNGDVWSSHLPQIFSGHIHEYQVLPGVVYVGTPLQQNYGEGTDKGLMMIYLEEKDGHVIIEEGSDERIVRPKFQVERIRLSSAPIRTTIHLTTADLPNFYSKIPPGCMVKVVLHIDAVDLNGIKQNPHYLALKQMVDKVVEKVESNKACLAENMVNEYKQKGHLPFDKKVFDLGEIVEAMLKDDPYTLSIFNTEINC